MSETIQHHSTRTFRDSFLSSDGEAASLLAENYEQCFILRIEQVLPFVKLPVPPSREDAHTLIFILHGSISLRAGSNWLNIAANGGVVLPAGIVFSIEQISDDAKGFAFHFSPSWLAGGASPFSMETMLTAAYTKPGFQIMVSEAAFLHPLLERLEYEYRTYELQRSDILRSYLQALLTEVEYLHRQIPAQINNAAQLIVSRFFAYLQNSIHKQLRVNDCAQALHVTPGHLCRVVKTITAKSPQYWLDETIMLRAQLLLRNPINNIASVADELGFEDHSYFSRFFRKHAGLSPGAWRKLPEKSSFLHEMC
jgi:AraC family transcriptional activator of pobA